MKPDNPARTRDQIERAHLRDRDDRSHTMDRYESPDDLTQLVQRFWVPVWSVPAGTEATQQVLQYPCALIVITNSYARFYGVATGLSTTTLTGDGWAFGTMLQPAAGSLITGASMTEYTDRFVDLDDVLASGGIALIDAVRRAMGDPDPRDQRSQREARRLMCDALRGLSPVDDEGLVINEIVAFVEEHPDLSRVSELAERFALSERSLQRLVQRRTGLTPKWLIQRRRLHEAAGRLRDHHTSHGTSGSLADLAGDLGYADQAHFTRDFQRVTGATPGEFAARYR